MKLLDPSVDIQPIVIDIDVQAHDTIVDHAKKFYGQFVPLLTFGKNNIKWHDVISFELTVRMCELPTVSMVINDTDFMIRSFLQDDMNIGICRIGYESFRMQFYILYTDITSGTGNRIMLNGILWNDGLWDTQGNLSFKDKSVTDIVKDICGNAKCGLYTYPNSYIDSSIPLVINPGLSPLEFISDLLTRWTDNIWCWDPYYFLHIGDYDTIINQELGKYSLDLTTGQKMEEEHDLIFYKNISMAKEEKSQVYENPEDDPHRFHIPIVDYDPETSFFPNSKFCYAYATEEDIFDPEQKDLGVGMATTNIFSGFDSHPVPFMSEIRKKAVPRRAVKVTTNFIIPEINPFSVVELQLYRNTNFGTNKIEESESDIQKDELNSGKKIVAGYSIKYKKKKAVDQDERLFEQEIYCI